LLLSHAIAVFLTSESLETHDHILLSQIRDFPKLEGQGQVPVFISPRKRVAQLYPQILGSHFVASYNSEGYGGGVRPRLHTYDVTESLGDRETFKEDGKNNEVVNRAIRVY
jgi:hypothetical protein